MYCDKCQMLLEDLVCPLCGNTKIRPVDEHDLCYLLEKEQFWSGMVADLLKQNKIPFFVKNKLGAGLTAKMGSTFEVNCFYVPYCHMQEAKDLINAFFTAGSV